MTSETTQNSNGLDLCLKVYIEEKFVPMAPHIRASITRKIGDLHDKLDIIIARKDTKYHSMPSEVVGEDHVDSNNMNGDFDDLIAEADDREFYITPPPSDDLVFFFPKFK